MNPQHANRDQHASRGFSYTTLEIFTSKASTSSRFQPATAHTDAEMIEAIKNSNTFCSMTRSACSAALSEYRQEPLKLRRGIAALPGTLVAAHPTGSALSSVAEVARINCACSR